MCSVCVYVFWRSLCSNFFWIERLFWEFFVLIGSLVELYVGLHSYLCFSHLEKLFRKAGSTPPWHLLDTLLSVELLKHFSLCNLDTSSIPGGSIEKAHASLIAPRHLVNQSSFYSWIRFFVSRYLLDTSAVDDQFLDTYLDSFLDTSRYLSCRALLKGLYILPSRFFSHFFDLSRSVRDCSSPKHSLFHSKPLPQGFFKLFQVFLHLVSV